MKAYIAEVGVLLTPDHEEFHCYNTHYNRAFGFFDEDMYCIKPNEKDTAIKEALDYVTAGVDLTYAILSEVWLPDDFDFEMSSVDNSIIDDMGDVVYSAAKFNGDIVEDF